MGACHEASDCPSWSCRPKSCAAWLCTVCRAWGQGLSLGLGYSAASSSRCRLGQGLLSMARLAVSMLESGARRMKWAAGSCWFGQGRIEANRQLVRWQKIRMSVGWKSRCRWPGQSRYLIRNWVKNLTKMRKYCNFLPYYNKNNRDMYKDTLNI